MSELDLILNQLFAEVKHIHDIQHQLITANNKRAADIKTLRGRVDALNKPQQVVTEPSEQVVNEI